MRCVSCVKFYASTWHCMHCFWPETVPKARLSDLSLLYIHFSSHVLLLDSMSLAKNFAFDVHTTTTTAYLWPFIKDNLNELVPEKSIHFLTPYLCGYYTVSLADFLHLIWSIASLSRCCISRLFLGLPLVVTPFAS